MGTKSAPIYATSLIGYLEKKCTEKSRTLLVPNSETILKKIGSGFLMIALYHRQHPSKNKEHYIYFLLNKLHNDTNVIRDTLKNYVH